MYGESPYGRCTEAVIELSDMSLARVSNVGDVFAQFDLSTLCSFTGDIRSSAGRLFHVSDVTDGFDCTPASLLCQDGDFSFRSSCARTLFRVSDVSADAKITCSRDAASLISGHCSIKRSISHSMVV
jgi:hypothetical protein